MPTGIKGFQKGHPIYSEKGQFPKGHRTWNKGLKGKQSWMNTSGLRPHKKGEYHPKLETIEKIRIANTGKKIIFKNPKERARKISIALTGKKTGRIPKSAFKKGKHYSPKTEFKKGQKMSDATKKKMSERMKGNKYAWKNGNSPENKIIRQSIEYRLWREAVFARDNWTCQKTGIKGGKLHPHHIQNFAQYPELRFAIDNGITLSEKAHKEFHKKYGIKNNTKEQIKEFINQND